jgi:exoribonuclease R
MCSLNPGV